MGKEKKLQAYDLGVSAEEIVANHYIQRGYTVLERRWMMKKTEIDLIVQKEDTIVIVEVKARSGKDEDAISTVTSDKRHRMVKAADAYISSLKGTYEYRFDIATVTGNKSDYVVECYEDAFVGADIF